MQWYNELIRWGVPAEEIAYCPRGMGPRDRLEMLTRDCAFQLVTYAMWNQDTFTKLLMHKSWGAYSFDEAHRLRKGRKGKKGTWEKVAWLRTKTRSHHMMTPLWLFTGTPVISDVTDTWPLLRLANPAKYRSRQDFALEMCRVSRTPYGLHVGKVRDPAKFRKVVGRYSLRRTWRDIPELANLERRDIPVPLELAPEDRRRHRSIRRDYRDPATNQPLYSSSEMIRTLRRLTIPTKLDALVSTLDDHPPVRWLVVCWYREHAELAYAQLKRVRAHTVLIHGGVTEKERQLALSRYRNYADCILVGTLGSLETGYNFQEGSYFAFLEHHYLSTTNDQAVGRLLRRGQEQPVLVYHFYADKSFDVKVMRVAERRGTDINRALDDFLEEDDDGF